MYAFKDGIARYYAPDITVDGGSRQPNTARYTHQMYFSYTGVRQAEHWNARQNGVQVEAQIDTLRDTRVETGHVAVIGGRMYKVGRIYQGVNKNGVAISGITLEKPDRKYTVLDDGA